MKRLIGLLAMAALLVTPTLAFASGQIGVYVAPKFVYGFTQLQGMKSDNGGSFIAKGNKSDNAFGGALAIGYDFQQKFSVPVRTELEYAAFSQVTGKTVQQYSSTSYDRFTQKLRIQTLFVNAYYDFRNATAFTPYANAGLGLAFIGDKGRWEWDWGGPATAGTKTSTNFAWNIGAGVAYAITDTISLDLGYRFAGLGEARTKQGTYYDWYGKTRDIYMHQVLLGLRFTF